MEKLISRVQVQKALALMMNEKPFCYLVRQPTPPAGKCPLPHSDSSLEPFFSHLFFFVSIYQFRSFTATKLTFKQIMLEYQTNIYCPFFQAISSRLCILPSPRIKDELNISMKIKKNLRCCKL